VQMTLQKVGKVQEESNLEFITNIDTSLLWIIYRGYYNTHLLCIMSQLFTLNVLALY